MDAKLFENGAEVARVTTNADGKPQWLIVSEDGEGMIYVTYSQFESFVKSLAHCFILMGKADEYREFWNKTRISF